MWRRCSPKEVFHLLKGREEHLVFAVGMGPGDVLVIEDLFDHVIGLLTIFGIEEIRTPFRGQIFNMFQPEPIAIDLDRGRRTAHVHRLQVFVQRPGEILLPEMAVIGQPSADLFIGFFMGGRNAPAVIDQGEGIFCLFFRRQGQAFKISPVPLLKESVACLYRLHPPMGKRKWYDAG
jgi:hypothetical protein